jgi:hypothetical protein
MPTRPERAKTSAAFAIITDANATMRVHDRMPYPGDRCSPPVD